jgi:stage V sporulation protein SpoVS
MATMREVGALVKAVAESYTGQSVELRDRISEDAPHQHAGAIAAALRSALRAYGIVAAIDSHDVAQARTWDDIAKRIFERHTSPSPAVPPKKPDKPTPAPTKDKRKAR